MLVLARRAVAFAALVLGASACGGGNASPITPHTSPSATPSGATPAPTAKPTATATPTAVPAGSLIPAATVATNLSNATSYYATLPHQSLSTDLHTLASHMVASGAFTAAEVEPGGIYATQPDGTHAVIFADVPEEVSMTAAARTRVQPANRTRALAPLGPPSSHEYAFLVDDADPIFNQGEGQAFASALNQAGFPGAGYGVDASSLSLENLDALNSGYTIDLLSLATHGLVVNQTDPELTMQSSTPSNAQTQAKYAAGLKPGGGLMYSVYATFTGKSGEFATLAFTPDYLVSKLHFTKGAFFYNSACYGHNMDIASHVDSLLSGAGVGIYQGWTKAVGAVDADETEAFIMDRLFGEYYAASSGLTSYATPHNVRQRPFPLADIDGALKSETRSSPLQPANPNENYVTSDVGAPNNALADPTGSTVAYMDIEDYGNENVTTPSLANAFPSIASIHVTESAAGGTLSIDGRFPNVTGAVTVTDSAGSHTLTPSSWTSSEVQVTIPNSGAASAGIVQVQTADDASAIASNPVPLTMWSGTLGYTETDDFTQVNGASGSGRSSFTLGFNVGFRADVHPTVPSIDASPVPQNLAFDNVIANSTGQMTAVSGTFTTDDAGDPHHATISIAQPAPVLLPGPYPNASNTFTFEGISGQPSGCNNGMQGAQDGSADTFCPVFTFATPDSAYCTDDDDGNLCDEPVGAATDFGTTTGAGLGGSITLQMDPSTYAISVTTSQTSVTRQFAGSNASGTANMTASFGSPTSPPDTSIPALRKRTVHTTRAQRQRPYTLDLRVRRPVTRVLSAPLR